jgi:hypothetical protein
MQARHDFNPDIGGIFGLKPFRVLYPDAYDCFEKAFFDYIKHVKQLEEARPQGETVKGLKAVKPLLELQKDENGFPLLPADCIGRQIGQLKYQKQLIRSFIGIHYSE